MAIIKTLTLEVEAKKYSVVGSDFYSMLCEVKEIQGRKWVDEGKFWRVPGTLDEIKSILSPLEILGEDETLDKELEVIAELQKYILENEQAIATESSAQFDSARKYSFNSKSRHKASYLRESGMLSHAINYAKLPIEELTEPQIATIKAAVRFMEGES